MRRNSHLDKKFRSATGTESDFMGGPRINEHDFAIAATLAGRKKGVTHQQLGAALGVKVVRAATILGRAAGTRGGLLVERTPDGKRARLLTYFTPESHQAWFRSHKPERKKIAGARTRARKAVKGKPSRKK